MPSIVVRHLQFLCVATALAACGAQVVEGTAPGSGKGETGSATVDEACRAAVANSTKIGLNTGKANCTMTITKANGETRTEDPIEPTYWTYWRLDKAVWDVNARFKTLINDKLGSGKVPSLSALKQIVDEEVGEFHTVWKHPERLRWTVDYRGDNTGVDPMGASNYLTAYKWIINKASKRINATNADMEKKSEALANVVRAAAHFAESIAHLTPDELRQVKSWVAGIPTDPNAPSIEALLDQNSGPITKSWVEKQWVQTSAIHACLKFRGSMTITCGWMLDLVEWFGNDDGWAEEICEAWNNLEENHANSVNEGCVFAYELVQRPYLQIAKLETKHNEEIAPQCFQARERVIQMCKAMATAQATNISVNCAAIAEAFIDTCVKQAISLYGMGFSKDEVKSGTCEYAILSAALATQDLDNVQPDTSDNATDNGFFPYHDHYGVYSGKGQPEATSPRAPVQTYGDPLPSDTFDNEFIGMWLSKALGKAAGKACKN